MAIRLTRIALGLRSVIVYHTSITINISSGTTTTGPHLFSIQRVLIYVSHYHGSSALHRTTRGKSLQLHFVTLLISSLTRLIVLSGIAHPPSPFEDPSFTWSLCAISIELVEDCFVGSMFNTFYAFESSITKQFRRGHPKLIGPYTNSRLPLIVWPRTITVCTVQVSARLCVELIKFSFSKVLIAGSQQ